MELKYLLAALLVVASVSTSQAQETKPKVEIFYETLNAAVQKFFVEQYRLVAENLLDSIDLRLYPYGNTVKNADNSHTCSFNEVQCEGNKIHACLIKAETLDASATVADTPINGPRASSFANCFFKNRNSDPDVDSLGERCLPAGAEADWEAIRGCVREDTTVVDIYGTITAEVAADIKDVGLVVRIGGTVNADAKTNLLGAVCTAITKSDGICENAATPAAKVKLAVYYEALNPDAGSYITKQLATYYHVLEDIADIDLIPYGTTQVAGSDYNCTLGESQCISNKFQALVINKYLVTPPNGDPISGPDRVLNFVSCLYKSQVGSVFSTLEICANQNLEDPGEYIEFIEAIKMNDPSVKTVFESMRTKTEAVTGSSTSTLRIPIVTLNGAVDYNAFDDLVQEICAQYTGPITAGICTKVPVTVFYEALNHQSRTLFLQQLAPVFEALYNVIDLKLLPAGRAQITPGHGFTCFNGADQCTAMKLQACALDYFWNDGNNYTDPIRLEVFQFLKCTFKNRKMLNPMDAAEICSEEALDPDAWITIHACFAEGTADGIFMEYIEETQSLVENIATKSIPIVHIYNETLEDLTTLRAKICSYFDDYHAPDYCQADQAPKVEISIYYESMSELSKYFFTTQYPWYLYVEEMANIKLFPAGNVIESTATGGKCDSDEATSACMGNKLQAMIIDRYNLHDDDGDIVDGTIRTQMFLNCVFNHPQWKDNIYSAYEYCTEETLIYDDWFDILVTAKSEEGDKIYDTVLKATAQFKAANGLETLDPVPWVTLDNQNHSKRAADDLLQAVCANYAGDKPLECTPVHVEVYYSGVNAQSRRFFIDQLLPTFSYLRERLSIELIPYGLADAASNITEECSTRDLACTVNTLQACAIDKFFKDEVQDNSIQWDGKNQTLAYIYCMFKNEESQGDPWLLAEKCANENIILADLISECAKQQEGKDLLASMRTRSLSQYEPMEHAPWIVVNGLRSAQGQSDLKTVVCDAMLGDKPDYCYQPTPAKVKVAFHYSTLDAKSQDYVINELYPHYRKLEDIIDLDVVPFGLMEILSQEGGNYTLICPGGEAECATTLIHGCLYAEYFNNADDPVSDNEVEFDGRVQFIEFLYCYFSSSKYPSQNGDAAADCGQKIFGDRYSTAHQCAISSLGRAILVDFRDQKVDRLLPHLTYTPWILVNGKHSYSIENHIQRTVCDSFSGTKKPQDCYEIYDEIQKPVVEIHYEPGDAGSVAFFTSSLMADHVNEIGVVNLIPFGRSTYDDTTKKCVGDESCALYKEHACLIDVYFENYTVKTLDAIACTFAAENPADPNGLNGCVDQIFEAEPDVVADPWSPIASCLASERPDQLLKEYAALVASLSPKISHVPWVFVNGEHNIEAEVSLCNELCSSYYPADKPPLCKPDLLPVNIYYETKNADVSALFLGGLSTYTEYLDEIGNFSFIPYGTTKVSGDTFSCPVDEDQCHANKVHACVINRFYNRSAVNSDYEANRIRTAGFLVCTFFKETGSPVRGGRSSRNAVDNANECLDENFEGDLWRDINFCARGLEGDTLMKQMGEQTGLLNPALTKAPVVTIGGKQNADAIVHLFQALCNSYSMVRAPLCATLPSFAINVGIYFSGNEAAKKYMVENVLPFYQEIVPVLKGRAGTDETKLHAILNPTLVGWGNTKYDPTNAENPFTCEGQNECYINRFFACVNHYHGAEPRFTTHLMEFALCFFSNEAALTSPQGVFNGCTNKVWIPDPFPQLETCATEADKEAYDIFLKAKAKTENNYPVLTTFPAVTINNIRNEAAEKNLLSVVCNLYEGYDRPAECDGVVTTPAPGTTPGEGVPTGTATPGDGSTTPGSGSTPPGTGSTPGGGDGTTTQSPPTTPPGSTPQPTTPSPGSGTMPAISVAVLLLSFVLARLL